MNITGLLIGIVFWCLIGYVVPFVIIKELITIPILVLAIMAMRQWLKSRKLGTPSE